MSCGCGKGNWDRLDEILAKYELKPSSLIPALQEVQAACGYLSRECLEYVARKLKLPASRVFGVASFFGQFRLQPAGRHVVRVCEGNACRLAGADGVLEEARKLLGIEPGETTADGRFTLSRVAHLGACCHGPVVEIDGRAFGPVKREGLAELLARYQ